MSLCLASLNLKELMLKWNFVGSAPSSVLVLEVSPAVHIWFLKIRRLRRRFLNRRGNLRIGLLNMRN